MVNTLRLWGEENPDGIHTSCLYLSGPKFFTMITFTDLIFLQYHLGFAVAMPVDSHTGDVNVSLRATLEYELNHQTHK